MLTVNNIIKTYATETILDRVSFTLNSGQRLGLVGPNGCGKTTLLRILVGTEKPDSGSVLFNPASLRIGYLPQGFAPGVEETIGTFLSRMEGDFDELAVRLENLAQAIALHPERSDLLLAYADALTRIQQAAESSGRNASVLAALGLDSLPSDLPVLKLSGGQKTRLALAGVLLTQPQLLILDEPTNHLDLEMLEWLEDWLSGFSGGMLVVSHDRTFLDHIATSILEIDAKSHRLRAYDGNYSAYLELKNAENQQRWQDYIDQQEEVRRLRAAAARVRGDAAFRPGGKGDSGDKFAKGYFSDNTQGTIRRAKAIEARVQRLLTTERIEKPKDAWEMKIEFGELPETGRDVIVLNDASIGYETSNPLLTGLNLTVRYGWRVALIGPNGSGKTSLLRTIAGNLPPINGQVRLGTRVRLGYMTQEQEELDLSYNALETIHAVSNTNDTEARSFLSKFLFKGDDVFTPARLLSFGERARLSLARLVASGCNLLLLDEPINHLDIPARNRFEQALSGFEGTILAVVHDRFFIQGFASHIWEIREQKVFTYVK